MSNAIKAVIWCQVFVVLVLVVSLGVRYNVVLACLVALAYSVALVTWIRYLERPKEVVHKAEPMPNLILPNELP